MISTRDIAATTNRVTDLLIKAELQSRGAERNIVHAEALLVSCQFLRQLAEGAFAARLTEEYSRALHDGHRAAMIETGAAQSPLGLVSADALHFEYFLKLEADLLVSVGMDRQVVSWLTSRIAGSIEQIKQGIPSPDDLQSALRSLAEDVCDRAEALVAAVQKGHWREVFWCSLGGVGLIAVNTASSALLSPIGVAASSSIGGGLVLQALKEIAKR